MIPDQEMNEQLEKAQAWYSKFGPLPAPESKNLAVFCTNIGGIVGTMRAAHNLPTAKIAFNAADVAHYDGEYLSIGTFYLSAKPYEDYRGLEPQKLSALMLSVVTGLAIHETGHSIHSTPFFTAAANFPEAFNLGNQLVEDWFLEKRLSYDFPAVAPFMKVLSDFFFPIPHADVYTLWESLDNSAIALKNRINFAAMLKNGRIVELARSLTLSPIALEILGIYDEVTRDSTHIERYNLGSRLTALLRQLYRLESEEWMGSFNDYSSRKFTKGQRLSITAQMLEDLRDVARIINENMPSNESIRAIPLYDSADSRSTFPMNVDGRFTNFAVALRKTQSLVGLIEARTSTGKLTSRGLLRAFTDGKAFTRSTGGQQRNRVGVEEIPVAILVDASGSTQAQAGSARLFTHFTNVAFSLIDSLVKARQPVFSAAFCVDSDNVPLFYELTSPFGQQQMTKVRGAFSTLLHEIGPQLFNPDAQAISRVSKMFPKTASKKLIIVISDGHPTFGFNSPVKETKEIVAKLRKEGFTIAAITYGQDAYEAGVDIYGKDMTLDATHSITSASEVIAFAQSLV